MATLKGGSRFPPLLFISTLGWNVPKGWIEPPYRRNFEPPLRVEISTLIIPPVRVEIVNHPKGVKCHLIYSTFYSGNVHHPLRVKNATLSIPPFRVEMGNFWE